MTFAECEIVADAALQLGALRDSLETDSDPEIRIIRNGITKVIGLLGALPIDAEPDPVVIRLAADLDRALDAL